MTDTPTPPTPEADDTPAEAAVDLVDPPEVETPPDAPDDTTDAPSEHDADDDEPKGAEAKKYRLRLREAEAANAQLVEQVTTMRRQLIEDIAGRPEGGFLKAPAALWAGGVDVADLLADDGTVDRKKVIAACDKVAAELGLTRIRRPLSVPNEGKWTPSKPRSSTDAMTDVVMGRDS